MRTASGQIRCDKLTCISIDSEVQLPPCPSLRRLPQIADVDSEASAVDEQVDRSMARERMKRDLTERLEAPGQRRVIGNGDLHLNISARERKKPSVCRSGR
jgi:hypothetical protein